MFDVVIIGGGITGLGAAWELQTRAPGLKVCLLEATSWWGGKVISKNIRVDGLNFLVDGGPDTLVTRKEESWQLASQLELLNQITVPASETKNIYVLDNGKARAIPLSPKLFFTTSLLSWKGRLRLCAEPFQPARRDEVDESLAEFATRRLGREASEKFIGPVLGGIYNTDPANQSIMVSSPLMRQMEKEDGSLIFAAIKRMFKKKKGQKRPPFINFKDGMGQLPATLAEKLTCEKHLEAAVTTIERSGNGYVVVVKDGERMETRAVLLATLANVSATLLSGVAPSTSSNLATIPHTNIGTISLVYPQKSIPSDPRINGLMIPRREKRSIDAITVTSEKMPERSHAGYALLRVFFGGGLPDLLDLNDVDLLEVVTAELKDLLNIQDPPRGFSVFRWKEGFPQATVGHLERIAAMEQTLPEGITLAGSSYRGVAVPDCLRSASIAVERTMSYLDQN